MNTFTAYLVGVILIIVNTVLTSLFTKQKTLRDFKNSLLQAKKDNKEVSITVDNLKISISSKDIKVKVLV